MSIIVDEYEEFDDDLDDEEVDVDERCDYILTIIDETRRLQALTPVDRIVLNLLEEIVELL